LGAVFCPVFLSAAPSRPAAGGARAEGQNRISRYLNYRKASSTRGKKQPAYQGPGGVSGADAAMPRHPRAPWGRLRERAETYAKASSIDVHTRGQCAPGGESSSDIGIVSPRLMMFSTIWDGQRGSSHQTCASNISVRASGSNRAMLCPQLRANVFHSGSTLKRP